jgi:type I restriction enzyme S subunit
MSELSFIEKLLDGVEVEWKALGEVCDFKNGFAFKSSLFKEAGLPIIRITNVDGKKINMDDVKYFDPSEYKENTTSYEVINGDILIAMSGATTGKIGFYTHEYPAYLNQRVGKFLPKKGSLNNRYLYHYLHSKIEDIYVLSGGGAQPNLSSNTLMAKIKIPIPCPDNPEKSLEIQAEIVRILDAFTTYTAELTAELNLRKQQYNHYRDQLLSFKEGEVEWKTLEEVANFANGKGHEKDISEGGRYIVVNSKFISTDGGVAKFSNSQICPLFKDDILLVMSDLPNGKALSKTFIVDEDGKYTLNQRIGGITVKNNNELLPKFLHYFLNRTPQLLKHNNGVDQTNLRKGQILEVKIPIISLTKQAQIVEILDKFDTYTKSISEGLPREIELRKQQYEYYRDKLLSFPKSETGVSKELKEQA